MPVQQDRCSVLLAPHNRRGCGCLAVSCVYLVVLHTLSTCCISRMWLSDDDGDAWDAPLLDSAHQLMQRPRLLICGAEGAGQAHLGPALLYALEGLPVHALGLPSLLSDASAR